MRYLTIRQRFKVPNYLSNKELITGLMVFDPKKCRTCGLCGKLCPAKSIIYGKISKDGVEPMPYIKTLAPDIAMCMACGDCLAACRQGAISMARGLRPLFYFNRITQAPELTYPHKY